MLAAALAVALAAPGCVPAAPRRVASVPSPSLVRAALDDGIEAAPPSALLAPPEPSRLRPCCAFGQDLSVKVGVVPVPGLRLETVRGPDGIGPHEYSPGLLQIEPSESGGSGQEPARENNGIVYTCRGGFVDTAHVRDFADQAWFLAGRIAPLLAHGGTFDLGDLGGRRRVVVAPVDARTLRRIGASSLAVAAAARLSFELSVWREIATWYGYESVPPWPEKVSSFSLEDLYSNLLGTKIASGILRTTPLGSRLDWERAMNRWLPVALDVLGIVSKEQTSAAFERVEGRWWDSSRRLPDWKITMRRRFGPGPVIEPLLAEAAPAPDDAWTCAGRAEPLRVATSFAGIRLASVARFEVDVDPALVEQGLVLPHGVRRLGARDFPPIVEAVRSATAPARADDAMAGR